MKPIRLLIIANICEMSDDECAPVDRSTNAKTSLCNTREMIENACDR